MVDDLQAALSGTSVVTLPLAGGEETFLADVCHQVRTPLNGILGSLELLLEAELTPETRELAFTAFQSALDLHQVFERELEALPRTR